MRADYLSYRRATNVSLLGIALQVVLGSTLLVYGILNADTAAQTASVFVLLGTVAWVALAIIFDQHRRERIEAIEQENFAEQDLASSSVFEDAAADLRVAARRLEILYKYMLPGVSLALGAALVLLGVLSLPGEEADTLARMNEGAEGVATGAFSGSNGWGIGIGLGVGVIGFVFARFTSGMARAKVWENLRGGSVYAVGSSILGVFLAVGHFADIAGVPGVLEVLRPAFAIGMIVLGVEVFLNFVLDIYRPRKQGEYPRPAFDSRLLGFAAAPDRIAESISDAINYQFGFEVTSSWFYRLLSKSFLWLVIVGGLAMWLMTSFTVVEPHQRALLLVNGKPASSELAPGLHVKPPWPFGRVIVPEFVRSETTGEGAEERTRVVREETATGVRVLELSAEPAGGEGPTLWQDETLRETFTLVQPGGADRSTGFDPSFGRDLAIVTVRVPVYYSVAPGGVQAFLELAPDAETRDEILTVVAQRELVQELGQRSIDQVIGPARNEIRLALQERIERAFASLNPDSSGTPRGAGVEVVFVGFEDARPPREAAAAFEQIFEARQKFEQNVALALEHRAETLAETIGSAQNAEAVIAAIEAYDALRTTGGDAEALRRAEVEIRDLVERSGGSASDAILAAQGDRWASHMTARASAAEYRGRLDAYRAAPEIVETRLRLQQMAEAIENLRLYIVDDEVKKRFRFDFNDVYLGTDVFSPGENDL
ncbi:MAG: SPFH domain-containing protein [Phycisphaerales bacterium]